MEKALTALRQHALLCLLQLLPALGRIRLQHPLTCSDASPTRHATLAPVRPGRQHAGDGVCGQNIYNVHYFSHQLGFSIGELHPTQ